MIIISKLDQYEYSSCIRLDNNLGNYFIIPSSIVLDKDISDKRVSVFSFFSIRRGLDYKLYFSINIILQWLNRKPERHKNGINDKLMQLINHLDNTKYLSCSLKKLNNSSCMEATFNLSKVLKECEQDKFAVIYLDELKTILDYKKSDVDKKDAYFNNDVILLVFAYLRMKIFRRRNKLLPEEINIDNKCSLQYDIKIRQLKNPDAYDCFYFEIAEELGISARTVSKAVKALNELNLIYSESLPRTKYKDKWRTDHTIFCNTYKREGDCLLADGGDYYLTEIKNKKKKLGIKEYKKIR